MTEGAGAGAIAGPDADAGADAGERYRRAEAIASFWHRGRLVAGSFWHGSVGPIDARDAWILDALGGWTSAAEAGRLAPPDAGPPFAAIAPGDLERLADLGLLERASAPEDAPRRFAAHWERWGFATQAFHATARHIAYAEDQEAARQVFDALVAEPEAPPPPVKPYPGARRIELPRDLPPLAAPLEAVLASRRTWRDLTGAPIPLARAAKLLAVSFGAVAEIDAGVYGRLLFKTSPSGGARHPTEAYVAALAVDGVEPGLYHYDPRGHALEEIARVDAALLAERVNGWLANQYWFAGSALVVFLAAIPSRLWFKYKHGRGYRVLLIEQGHLGQTFCLTATALGLGPWQTAAMKDREVERALGLDGVEEVVLYALGAGVPRGRALHAQARVELWGERAPRPMRYPEP